MYKKYYPDRTLEHSAKGSQKKDHKYLSRIWKNGKWLYQYAKKAYGSQAREDMDKYDDIYRKTMSNRMDAIETSRKARENGDKRLEDRAEEYYDQNYARGTVALTRASNASSKYYDSAAYKVDKATGRYAKDEMKRYLKEGGTKQGEYYNRRLDEYNKSIGGKTEKVSKAAKRSAEKVKNISKEKVDRGRKLINEFFSKSKPKVTVTDTFTGKKRTPKKPKSASDTVNIKELSKKNKKK